MRNKIFLIDTSSDNKKDFFKRELPGSLYDDKTYSLTYKEKIYDVYQCDLIGFNLGGVCAYRLEEYI